MGTPLRVLIVEDSEDDALLVLRELRQHGYEPFFKRVETPEAMAAELERKTWDIVISDYVMPRFTGLEALKLMLKKGLDLPFIVTSGKADEETLVGAMKAGVNDYIMKNNLSRLVPAVERELREAAVRRERKKAEEALRESEERFRLAGESSTDLIYEWDIRDRVEYFGKIDELLGYAPSEFPRTLEAWANIVHPDDRDRVMAAVKNHLEKNESYKIEYRVRKKDGTYNYWWVRGTAVRNEKGNPYRWIGAVTDITERKRAEEALVASGERYRTLFEAAAEGILVADVERRQFKYANPAICKMLGYTAEELTRLNVADIHPKEALDHVVAEFEALARGEKNLAPDIPCLRKDGSVIYADIATAPVVIDGRKCNVGFFTDITERKRAEEALRASEDRYRTVFEAAAEGILVADVETRQFKYANPAICGMLGYTPEELIRLGVAGIHPKEALDHVVAEFEAQARGEKILAPEIPCLRKDGSVIYVSITSAPVVIDGRKCNVGFFTDITERKRAEETLREQRQLLDNILNSIPTPVFYKDIKGTYLGCNSAYLDFMGLPRERVIGKTISEIAPADLVEIYLKADQHLINTGGSHAFEVAFPFTDGSTHEVMSHKAVFRNVEGAISGIVGVLFDISERKRAEKDLGESEEAAKRLAHENAVMAEIGRIISSTLNIEEVYERFAAEVRKLIPFDRIVVSLNNPEETTATVAYASGLDLEERKIGDVFPLPNSSNEKVMRTRAGWLVQPESVEELEGPLSALIPTFQVGLRSMMSVPLTSRDQIIGALHLRSKKSKAYTDRDLRLAERIAAQITGAIANAQLFLEWKRAEEQLKASLKEKEVLLREIHHRVKNNLQVISSLLRLQSRFIEDDAICRVFKESQDRVKTMAIIHEKLYQSTDLARIDFAGYIRDLTTNLYRSYGVSQETISLRIHAKSVFLGINMAIPCGLIINELVSNCLKHAFPGGERGEIYIDLSSDHDQIILTVGDNGGAFPKGLDFRNTESLGLQLVLSLTEQLEGAIELHSDGKTEFRIVFPAGHNR